MTVDIGNTSAYIENRDTKVVNIACIIRSQITIYVMALTSIIRQQLFNAKFKKLFIKENAFADWLKEKQSPTRICKSIK
jgi:hypothetical protein